MTHDRRCPYDAQQLSPIDGPPLLGVRELKRDFFSTAIQPPDLTGTPSAGVGAAQNPLTCCSFLLERDEAAMG
tara:strand:- start:15 stop:233 length:219 start_codon:yes stop_codon:yes gene_type:complete